MGDRGATFAAEDAVDVLATIAFFGVVLSGALDRQLIGGNDDDERVGAACLPLAVIAMIVAYEERLGVNGEGGLTAKAVSRESHDI